MSTSNAKKMLRSISAIRKILRTAPKARNTKARGKQRRRRGI